MSYDEFDEYGPHDVYNKGAWQPKVVKGTVAQNLPTAYLSGSREDRVSSLKGVLEMVGTLIEDINSWPDEPEDGSVVIFSKRFTPKGKRYSYAALNAVGRWFITGNETTSFTWAELMDWMGDGKATLKMVTETEKL